ncbi:GAF and ANTAR domain-containing protein [Cellulomonas fimi]|uniref:GAF and ANTAR domain-containing protein n=1 Tax=Cellulomonas fimi TaxID=1708 RepID=A0A7Y0LY85_CELFI|nr:GAF and ANTAR domain-containing protein [Cellulomonas fimi]NMR20106.1 GAF and ANTAR domain-containing protein [Cellulomonas fimi]
MPVNLPLADELALVFARLSGVLLSQETVDTSLRLICELAQLTLPDSSGAGVTLVDAQGSRTTAASDQVAERADALQYELHEGPCLTAAAHRVVVRVDDIEHDSRWPRWARAVQPLGVHATLSSPMIAGDVTLGAIKVYGRRPGVYDADSERTLTLFAAQAAIMVANVQSLEAARRLSDQLKDALRTRDVIATAKGVLVGREGVDQETAFARLVSMSQRDGKKLRDVAELVVRSAVRRRR